MLCALLLSMAPVGVPIAHAAEPASTNITCSSLDTCILLLVYWVGPGIAGGVAYIGAYFFSIVIQLSLNSTAYALDFLSTGWTTVRDIANMAFIFILIYIALTVMLSAETSGTIKTLAVVIVIALLVNFSFFFTRVVIDAGNIVAVQFYNALPYQGNVSGTQTKDLSLSIMGAINPQELLNSQMLDRARKMAQGDWGGMAVLSVIYISVAAIFWILFFVFLQVGIKFMMRIVGLWFVLIASPLAFVAKTMKQTSHFFDQWLDYLIKFSLYPAIFLFMFWILTKFTTSILSSGGNGTLMGALYTAPTSAAAEVSTMAVIATIMIRMGFVVAVLYVGLKVSDWIVKEGSATAMKVSGWSTGKAFGTAGWLGRASIGSIGGALATSQRLATSKNVLAQGLWRAGRYASRSSFDARGLPGVKTSLGVLGGDVIKGTRVDVGEAGGEGGVWAQAKKVSDDRAKARDERENERRDLQNKRDRKQMATLDAQIKPHKDAISLASAGYGPLDPAITNLIKERQRIQKNIQNYSKRELESLSAKDLDAIAHVMKESQIKTIKDSTKWTDAEKEKATSKWERESPEAPKQEMQKQVEMLRKLHKDLAGMGVSLSVISKHTDPTGKPVITGDTIREMTEELKTKLAEENQKTRDSTLGKAERVSAGKNALTLNQDVRDAIKNLNDNRKKTAEGEYAVTK